jgi:chemotaxis signal transduction protein
MISETQLLLEVRAADARYFVPRSHVDRLEILLPDAAPAADERGRPVVVRELAPLLGLQAPPRLVRRQALRVVLRRRTVMLLVDRIEDLEAHSSVQPLAPLLRRRLVAPWVIGAVAEGDTAVLVLDLRRIAADVALGAA